MKSRSSRASCGNSLVSSWRRSAGVLILSRSISWSVLSVGACCEPVDDFTQPTRPPAGVRERGMRLDAQLEYQLPGGSKSHHRHASRLLLCGVLACSLAEALRSPFDIENIVDYLECEPYSRCTAIESALLRCAQWRPTGCAKSNRCSNQRAGLEPMHAFKFVDRQHGACAREIERLPACHAARSGGTCQNRDPVGHMCFGQHFESESLQRVTGKQRHRFSVRHVTRWPAAAQDIVVHTGQVIVNERIGMDQLDCRCGSVDDARITASELAGGVRQQSAHALSPAQH